MENNEQQSFDNFLIEMCQKYSSLEELSAVELAQLTALYLSVSDNAERAIMTIDDDRFEKVCQNLCRVVALNPHDSQLTIEANKNLANALAGACYAFSYDSIEKYFKKMKISGLID